MIVLFETLILILQFHFVYSLPISANCQTANSACFVLKYTSYCTPHPPQLFK